VSGDASVEAAIAAIGRGEIVVLQDDDGVGHLVRDARGTSGEDVVAMVSDGGIFSLVLAASRADELRLEQRSHGSRRIAASVDAREGTTTGISADERANTARVAADPATVASDLVVPGHVPPLIADDAGVFALRGAPEAALDLVRAAGGSGAAATSAILAADGSVAEPARVLALAAGRGLVATTITAVAARRIAAEHPLKAVRHERLMTDRGPFAAVTFEHAATGESHLALVRGSAEGRTEVPLAVHTSSPAADLLAALAPTGQAGLAQALRRFARVEAGILVHLGERPASDPYALDLVAAVVAELAPASVLPLDESLARPLGERGIEVVRPRSAPRSRSPRGDRCAGLDYEVDTAL
jgi:3,4-dihydroxy 2-butanone 4-phosphate synthase / GTP cyclohydrolase II